jgi:hypothetical protein
MLLRRFAFLFALALIALQGKSRAEVPDAGAGEAQAAGGAPVAAPAPWEELRSDACAFAAVMPPGFTTQVLPAAGREPTFHIYKAVLSYGKLMTLCYESSSIASAPLATIQKERAQFVAYTKARVLRDDVLALASPACGRRVDLTWRQDGLDVRGTFFFVAARNHFYSFGAVIPGFLESGPEVERFFTSILFDIGADETPGVRLVEPGPLAQALVPTSPLPPPVPLGDEKTPWGTSSQRATSPTPAAPAVTTPTLPAAGQAPSIAAYGEISTVNGLPRTRWVRPTIRHDGTPVRGYYRSK